MTFISVNAKDLIPFNGHDTMPTCVMLDSDGNFERATYIGPLDLDPSNAWHVVCLYDVAGRAYPVMVNNRGIVEKKLGIVYWLK